MSPGQWLYLVFTAGLFLRMQQILNLEPDVCFLSTLWLDFQHNSWQDKDRYRQQVPDGEQELQRKKGIPKRMIETKLCAFWILLSLLSGWFRITP